MKTTSQSTHAAPRPDDPRPQVLPEVQPLAMPHQDLAISPVITNAARWLRLPGNAVRSLLSLKRRRQTQETHHVA